jgi:N4-gp56 family major capsid protein
VTDWWADRIDTALFNQLAGNTGVSDTRYTGHNSTVAPTATTNWVYANNVASETEVASASASNVFKLSMIDALVEKAKTNSPLIRPIKVEGKDKFLLFLHPYQVTDLRQNTNTGQWLDIQKAVYQGSKQNNPIYDGSLAA